MSVEIVASWVFQNASQYLLAGAAVGIVAEVVAERLSKIFKNPGGFAASAEDISSGEGRPKAGGRS